MTTNSRCAQVRSASLDRSPHREHQDSLLGRHVVDVVARSAQRKTAHALHRWMLVAVPASGAMPIVENAAANSSVKRSGDARRFARHQVSMTLICSCAGARRERAGSSRAERLEYLVRGPNLALIRVLPGARDGSIESRSVRVAQFVSLIVNDEVEHSSLWERRGDIEKESAVLNARANAGHGLTITRPAAVHRAQPGRGLGNSVTSSRTSAGAGKGEPAPERTRGALAAGGEATERVIWVPRVSPITRLRRPSRVEPGIARCSSR
jgi:hypothetical protein